MKTKARKVVVKSSQLLSEKEAYLLLQTVPARGGGLSESIREKIQDLIHKGQNFGLISATTHDNEKLTPEECKKIVRDINHFFEKRDGKHRVRYVPAKEGFLFVPMEKIEEMFGKS